MDFVSKSLAALLWMALLSWASPACAVCLIGDQIEAQPSPLRDADAAAGPTTNDRRGRMVAPVTINGQGPFRFIVDTGANRSALSQGLAVELGLTSTASGEVHSVYGVTVAPLVEVASLNYGALSLPSGSLPLLQGAVLAGESGLLGVDGMRGRRLRMDFERRCIEIMPASGAPRLYNWTTVQGELRFGHLVVVPGRIRNHRVNLLIDTGSDTSMANFALRDQLRGAVREAQTTEQLLRAYTIGDPVVLDSAVLIPRLSLGQDLDITRLVAYVGDFHIFRLWGLENEPTLLIGMDVLSQVRGLAIDYERATVHFRLRQDGVVTRLIR